MGSSVIFPVDDRRSFEKFLGIEIVVVPDPSSLFIDMEIGPACRFHHSAVVGIISDPEIPLLIDRITGKIDMISPRVIKYGSESRKSERSDGLEPFFINW
jgi:hypothetical protein